MHWLHLGLKVGGGGGCDANMSIELHAELMEMPYNSQVASCPQRHHPLPHKGGLNLGRVVSLSLSFSVGTMAGSAAQTASLSSFPLGNLLSYSQQVFLHMGQPKLK